VGIKMPRRKSVNVVRDVGVDPVYSDGLLQKFINILMWRGKKNTARRIVYGATNIIASKLKCESGAAVDVFKKAVENCIPLIEVRARRVGGSVYQVPAEVRPLRGQAIAFRNIISAASARPSADFSIRLAAELLDASENKGGAVKNRLDKHRMAEASRAFSHLVW
jgi:small subunit ribosomal protein S7